VEGDIPVDSDALLVTDLVNLKIKSAQSFEGAHRNRVCIRIFIEVSTHIYIYINIYVYTVFKKNARRALRGKKRLRVEPPETRQ
jgi:hypothetical protein